MSISAEDLECGNPLQFSCALLNRKDNSKNLRLIVLGYQIVFLQTGYALQPAAEGSSCIHQSNSLCMMLYLPIRRHLLPGATEKSEERQKFLFLCIVNDIFDHAIQLMGGSHDQIQQFRSIDVFMRVAGNDIRKAHNAA